jgi:hypothetical protein
LTRRSVKRAWAIATPLALLHLVGECAAQALPDHDNGILTGIYGFAESTEGGHIIDRGQHGWDTSLIIASHNVDETRDGEDLRLDGETTRLALTYRYGLSDKLDIGIEVPYLKHEPGTLDSMIDNWHNVLSFVGGGARARREEDQLEIYYADSQATLVDISDRASGISDIRLLAGWRLSESEGRATALRFGIKLPTGDGDRLLGSGGTDVSFGIAGDVSGFCGNSKLSSFYRANVTYLGEPDRLADRYKKVVGQVSFGLGYRLHQVVDLKLQSRIRSAVYDSDIESLGGTSVSLTFGADFRVSNHYRLVLSMSEDARVGSVPDVSFQLALRYISEALGSD